MIRTEAKKTGNAPVWITGDTADIAFYAAGILIGSLCLTGLAVFWRRRRKFSDGSKLLTGVIVFAAALLLTSGSVYGSSGKGDLNGDGGPDDADVELLEKHLIERELLPEDRRDYGLAWWRDDP